MTLPLIPESGTRRRQVFWIAGCVVSLLIGLAIGYSFADKSHRDSTTFATPYQAVLLSNGAVYYGKLAGYGTLHPDPDGRLLHPEQDYRNNKQVTNVLVKRGKELHGPDRMYLNASQIVFVEPVDRIQRLHN